MRETIRRWYPAGLLAASVLLSVLAYPHLPERVATHWGLDGEPDGWSSPLGAVLFAPLLVAGLWAFFRVLPRIDPRGRNYARFPAAYHVTVNATLSIVAVMHAATLAIALGWPISMTRFVCVALGLMLMVIGNVMPRARPNFFVGVRTPWTLSSDRVWERTHRVAGYLFVAAGAVTLLAATLPSRWAVPVLLAAVSTAALSSVVYSYVLWSRGER